MPYINIDVHVDLDEFYTNELIEELGKRMKNERSGCRGFGDPQRITLIKMLKELKYCEIDEILIKAKERYSLDQLKSLLHL